jgi:hypothetical protein
MSWWELGLLILIFFVGFWGGGILFTEMAGRSVIRSLESLLAMLFKDREGLK